MPDAPTVSGLNLNKRIDRDWRFEDNPLLSLQAGEKKHRLEIGVVGARADSCPTSWRTAEYERDQKRSHGLPAEGQAITFLQSIASILLDFRSNNVWQLDLFIRVITTEEVLHGWEPDNAGGSSRVFKLARI